MNKLHLLLALIASLVLEIPAHSQDRFAEIASRKYADRSDLLITPQPPVLPEINLPVSNNPEAVFKSEKPVSTPEELYAELDKLRKKYEPFMQNLAPEVGQTRAQLPLTEFKWRIETPEDQKNFGATLNGEGNWKTVTIPHFGPPIGRGVTYYYKDVNIDNDLLSKRLLFICFKGVDYKASVFVNGAYCGSHEGFFAPFEFEISRIAHPGKNTILVKVENDYVSVSENDDKGNPVIGDKIYAASGPGYDDPDLGWHHCPAGMGIYQDCYLEARAPLHINDLYVRPVLQDSVAEVWIEVNNYNAYPTGVTLRISIYGQNFSEKVLQDLEFLPSASNTPGVKNMTKSPGWQDKILRMGYGVNFIRIPVKMKNYRLWDPETPWLYQLQVRTYDTSGNLTDAREQQFGMRSFTMDTVSSPKGRMYLNGKMIRLRGANTMGFEQHSVMHKDWKQLTDDILMARLCNMNYLRFTQRPVQSEVYDFCDKLGLLNQTDLPLFGTIRYNKITEIIKQGEEMERLVRKHPSTIMVTYINERGPNADGFPQRSVNTAEEYDRIFAALDQVILLSDPDRVIKSGEGDYDPPSPGLPDSHCYNTWYNGHGLGLGQLYKGYWQKVKPGWLYGCGEFGSEGIDSRKIMEQYYPKSWLPKNKEDEKNWNPGRIAMAQSNKFHLMWYNTQHSLNDWIEASQNHQAWATKFVAEAFRRDDKMVSCAIHLFIDAWPAAWMKSIMDVDRQPKKAFYAYRNAMEPLMISLRSDRNKFYSGEVTDFEAWICNDLNTAPSGYKIKYQIEKEGKILFANQADANIPVNSSRFQGFIRFKTPETVSRKTYVLRIALVDEHNKSKYQNEFDFEVFPKTAPAKVKVFVIGNPDGKAGKLAEQAGYSLSASTETADVILVDDFEKYLATADHINELVSRGKKVVFLELTSQTYQIANTSVEIDKTGMNDFYFVSPSSGHRLVRDFRPLDFRLWYNGDDKLIDPLLGYTVISREWTPILLSTASNWSEDKGTVMAASELKYGKGVFRICEVKLTDRIQFNPTALLFFNRLLTE
jgi:hypothetical protein